MKLEIETIARHRNGICGAPFHVLLFSDIGLHHTRKLAIVFDAPHHVAVLDVARLSRGDIAFVTNSWRGDVYEPHLRKAIDASEQECLP
tara:strand:+ start:121842 stop:122108 length:267 start_codon:yes stop_codon:yes gene_type:complete